MNFCPFDPVEGVEDTSITEYHSRVASILPDEREQIRVTYSTDKAAAVMDVWASDQLVMYAANTLIELAKVAFQKDGKTASTMGLQQLAAQANDEVFEKAGIPPKYWRMLRDMNKYIADQNVVAHENMGSFAMLLMSPAFKDTEAFHRWRDAFLVVCNKSIEDVYKEAVDSRERFAGRGKG